MGMTRLDVVKRVIMGQLEPNSSAPMFILAVHVRNALNCTPDEARYGAIAALRELCDAREVVEMDNGEFRRRDDADQAP